MDLCLSDYCKMMKAKEACANEMGLAFPVPLPETQVFFDCWTRKKNALATEQQGIIANIFDIGAGIFGKSNQNQQYPGYPGTYPSGTYPYGYQQPTVMGMPPAMGYLTILLILSGVGYGIYTVVKK